MAKILLFLLATAMLFGKTTLKFSQKTIHFSNSKQKKDAQHLRTTLNYKNNIHQIVASYSNANVQTYQPPLHSNLHVNKYTVIYNNSYFKNQTCTLGYLYIDDNLAKEVDGGSIFTLGYRYKAVAFQQHISVYHHFSVLQSDIFYNRGFNFSTLKAVAIIGAKYIYLKNRKSNHFSANAKKDYLAPVLKFKLHYKKLQVQLGAVFGRRVFGVMNNALTVNHHAMEFYKTYIAGVAYRYNNLLLQLNYSYQEADELPLNNQGVKLNAAGISLGYSF